MCARYEMSASPRAIMAQFHLDAPPPVPNTDDMRPTDQALIIDGAGPRLMRWGLAVSWGKKPMINARAETLAEKATFRPLLERRCLVPMTAYLEWRIADDGSKRKNRIAPAAGPAAFAGLTDGDAFTIVTCAPAPAIAHIHNRMPVILDAQGAAAWTDDTQSFATARAALHPYEGALMYEEQTPQRAQGELF
ncbi:SOS response-associated peptidase family protein [Thalassospiraceae bacterium LMO-SO8]|nr:SOS response-associated peptidase [Alphaproteobacteria bacterium LMO-S08]WND75998.1 SOS response-associated peptidase family protein [Thalassospiraceae bacterium LMO-SO8]